MAQVNIATIDAMLKAIDDALAAELPVGGIADAAALTALTGRVSDAETALGERALVTALDGEIQARTDAVSGLQTDVNARIPSVEKGAASGVATLGVDGKIPADQLPALATTETFVVASQAEQLALAAQPGDFAVRTDFAPHRNYILTTTDPSNFNNWRQLSAPGAVTSVDGMTGAVTLGSTAVVANTLARRKPTGALSVAAAQVDGEAVELAQLNAALTAFGRDRGTGTALPDTDLRRGDVYFHTGQGCLLVYIGFAWRQIDVSELTSTQRIALVSGTLYNGFRVYETDTKRTYQWDSTLGTGGTGAWDQIAGPPEQYSVIYASTFADLNVSPWQPLRILKFGRTCWTEGAFTGPVVAQNTLTTIGTVPVAVTPIANIKATVSLFAPGNGYANMVILADRTLSFAPVSAATAPGWDCQSTGLRWRTNS